MLRAKFMRCHVSFHVPHLGELFVALRTLERFHPVVAEHVPLQTVQGEEAFGALDTGIRPVSRV